MDSLAIKNLQSAETLPGRSSLFHVLQAQRDKLHSHQNTNLNFMRKNFSSWEPKLPYPDVEKSLETLEDVDEFIEGVITPDTCQATLSMILVHAAELTDISKEVFIQPTSNQLFLQEVTFAKEAFEYVCKTIKMKHESEIEPALKQRYEELLNMYESFEELFAIPEPQSIESII